MHPFLTPFLKDTVSPASVIECILSFSVELRRKNLASRRCMHLCAWHRMMQSESRRHSSSVAFKMLLTTVLLTPRSAYHGIQANALGNIDYIPGKVHPGGTHSVLFVPSLHTH